MKPYIIITVIVISIILFGNSCREAEKARKAETPIEQRPYTVQCFTPQGWQEYKTFKKNPTLNRVGAYLWLIEREDGTTFRSSMCQIETTEGVKQ